MLVFFSTFFFCSWSLPSFGLLGRHLLLLTVAMLGKALLFYMHGIDIAGVKQFALDLSRTKGYGTTAKEASSPSGKHSLWVLRNFCALLLFMA